MLKFVKERDIALRESLKRGALVHGQNPWKKNLGSQGSSRKVPFKVSARSRYGPSTALDQPQNFFLLGLFKVATFNEYEQPQVCATYDAPYDAQRPRGTAQIPRVFGHEIHLTHMWVAHKYITCELTFPVHLSVMTVARWIPVSRGPRFN